MSIMKALRLQDMSCSPSRKLAISSGASGIRKSKFLKHKHRFGLLEIRSRGWEKLIHLFLLGCSWSVWDYEWRLWEINSPFFASSWSVGDREWRLWEIRSPFFLGAGLLEIMSRGWEKLVCPFLGVGLFGLNKYFNRVGLFEHIWSQVFGLFFFF